MARQTNQSKTSAGKASLSWVVLLAALAVALGVVAALLINGTRSTTPPPPQVTQEQIDAELDKLQTDFKTAIQEKQELGRLAAQARSFTEKYPGQQRGYVLLAQARLSLDQWEEAYAAWQKALSFDDQAYELCKMTGLCAAKLSDIDTAIAYYQQAVDAKEGQADNEVYAALGRLYLSLNDTDHAQVMYERAEKAPGPRKETNYRHQAYAGLADVASVRGDLETALSWVDRAIKLSNIDSDADSVGYHIQKARIYMDAGQDDDAAAMLNYTWSQYAKALWRIESARLRARLYERADQLDAAVDHLQNVTEWHRQSEQRQTNTLADFTALLAKWQIKAGRIDAANISLHNLQTLLPQHPAIDKLKAQLR